MFFGYVVDRYAAHCQADKAYGQAIIVRQVRDSSTLKLLAYGLIPDVLVQTCIATVKVGCIIGEGEFAELKL